jgi:hypothetical protein
VEDIKQINKKANSTSLLFNLLERRMGQTAIPQELLPPSFRITNLSKTAY